MDSITPDRWVQITDLLGAAIERPAAERDAFVAAAAGADDELRREVASLLVALDSAADRFETSPTLLRDKALAPTEPTDRSGQRVGAYQVVRLVGTGGMGDVYEAVRADGDFVKRVALKVIQSGRAS